MPKKMARDLKFKFAVTGKIIVPRPLTTASETIINMTVGVYRTAGNFRETEIFAIFAIKRQLAKICSREKFFHEKFLADELRTPSTVC